jgi:hypothetical protein
MEGTFYLLTLADNFIPVNPSLGIFVTKHYFRT